MAEKRIVFVGEGTPLLRAIDVALGINNVKIVAIFVPEKEVVFFKQKLVKNRHIGIESVTCIERDKFEQYDGLVNCDYLISFNNMHLIDDRAIQMFRCGGINYHAGSLPEYAGSYTFQWAIRNNESEFASTFHAMEGKTDAGPIIHKRKFAITSSETGLSLLIKSINVAVGMVAEILNSISSGIPLPRIDQDLSRRGFYSMKDILESGCIDWSDDAEGIERLVRAADFSPLPSPTYTPYTTTPLGTMQVLKARVSNNSISEGFKTHRPGTVINVSGAGIEVKTGNDRPLILTTVVINGTKYQLKNILRVEIEPGDCLGCTGA